MLIIKQIINSVYSSNTFILYTQKCDKCWIIDCGDVNKIIEAIPKNKKLCGVFFTHTHYDHIYGINKLLDIFPGLRIFTNSFGKEALLSSKLNYSKYHIEAEDIICSKPDNIEIINDGSKINLFDNTDTLLSIYFTPGHDKSCICYSICTNFFSGDSYIPGLKVIANFPNSNRIEAEKSKQIILALSQNCNLYPGHGNMEYK